MDSVVLKAHAIYRASLRRMLCGSPLSDIDEWIATGKPPTLAEVGEILPDSLASAFTWNYGFSIPCLEAVEAVRKLQAPLVEIGAGSGYWSALLRAAGVDILATDPSIGSHGFVPGTHHDAAPLTASDAVQRYSDRDVLCSWPSKGADWCREAVSLIKPGRHFIYLGEPRGGLCASDALFDLLEAEFDLVGQVITPRFERARDGLKIFLKR